ncbi:hypothetical protein D3C75_1208840 [compost metagenome]
MIRMIGKHPVESGKISVFERFQCTAVRFVGFLHSANRPPYANRDLQLQVAVDFVMEILHDLFRFSFLLMLQQNGKTLPFAEDIAIPCCIHHFFDDIGQGKFHQLAFPLLPA